MKTKSIPGVRALLLFFLTSTFLAIIEPQPACAVVLYAPIITGEPTNQAVTADSTATFSMTAEGNPSPSYQWYFDNAEITDATNSVLTLSDVQPGQAGAYYAVVTNVFGSATSATVTLTVNATFPPEAPYIITEPTNQTVTVGDTATFGIIAVGGAPLSYQWYFNGPNVLSATNATLTLDNVSPTDAGPCYVIVADAYGSVTSSIVTLTVNSSSPTESPYIITQPTGQMVATGGSATFSVTAGGSAPLSYLWYFDETNVVGTNATLVLNDVTTADAGSYQVFISNAYGSTNSLPVTLAVSSSTSCDPVPSGIVSWWPGEGNADDIIGSNNGIPSSGMGYTAGEVGQAFAMDSTNANFYAPASASLDVGAHGTGLTIEAWIDPSNVNGLQPIVEWNSSPEYPPHSGNIGVQFWIGQNPGSAGVLCATFMDTNVQNGEYIQVTSPSGALVPNVWQHVAVTYEPTNGYIILYINGAIVASQYWGQIVPPTSYNFWVGHRPGDEPGDWTYGTFLSGPLDELSLYNRALSSNEIAAIYQAGSAGKCPPITSSMAPYIITQPASETVTAGGTATFSVTAGGTAPLSYQWYSNGTNIQAATNATLIIPDVTPANAGPYYVTVENSYGSTNSDTATLTVSSSITCDPVPSGIVSWWPAEGNTDDIIGGNDGVVTNGTVGYAPAEVGTGFNFDGGPNRLIVPDSPSLNFRSNQDFSIEGWIRAFPTNTPQGVMSILEKRQASGLNCQGYDINLTYGTFNFQMSDNYSSGNSLVAVGGPNILDGNLHHVAVTVQRDSTTGGHMYVDGVMVNQFDPTSQSGDLTTTEPLRIGNHPDPAYTAFWDGQIDELSLYNRALSSNEIAAIYQAGSEGKCPPTSSMAPSIITQPASATVTAGDTATFSVTAGGAAPLSYLWYLDETNIVGTNATLVLNDVTTADAGAYQVFVSNAYGSTNSIAAMLTVNSSGPSQAPYIIAQPTNQIVTAGGIATFSVTAGGTAPLSYQWYSNGTNIQAATNATLVIPDVTPANAGPYYVTVENPYGSTNSDTVTLTVNPAPSCDPAPSGIIGWWPGEGNANDIIDTNNGILDNGVTFVEGVVGEAFHFNGSNQDVQIPYSTTLEPTNITVECWVKLDALASPVAAYPGLQYIVFKQNARSGDFEGYDLEKNRINGQDVFRFQVTSVDGQQVPAAATTVPQPGVWYHLAGTYDGTTVRIYVNGVLEGTAVAGFPMNYGTEPVYFGTTGQGYDGRLEGALDEVSIYDRAISSNEIAAIYQAGSEGKCPPPLPSMAPYIVTQPASQTVTAGGTATFSVTVSGATPLEYLWYFDETNLVGTNATLVLSNVATADAGPYYVSIENAYGSTNSQAAILTVNPSGPSQAPYIIAQPTNETVTAGGTATFSVSAGGAAPLSYLWYFDETNVVGTNAALVLDDVTAADAGRYQVFVSNAYGSSNSVPVTLIVSSSSSCDPVPPGIIGWWPGEGNANDIIGTNNGILENGVTFTDGIVGEAFHFNGSNQDVQIPYSTTLEPTNITVECWVKLDALASPVAANPGLQYIVFKQNSRTGNFEGYDLEKNRINGQDVFRFQVTSVDGQQVPAASTTIPQPGVWYHLAGTYDGTTVKMYVNGVLEGTAVAGFPMDYGTEPVYFATSGAWWDGRFDGALDEVSIYNRALSSNEIAAIYQAGSEGKCPPSPPPPGAPDIITQPASETVTAGATATFSVTAGGAAPLEYLWYFDETNLVGTNATLVLTNVTSANAGPYNVSIKNAYGPTNSAMVTLTVNPSGPSQAPFIIGQPTNETVVAGGTASFSVTVTGAAPLEYLWYFDTTNLVGTNVTLVLTNVTTAQAGPYFVSIANAYGLTNSHAGVLKVNAAISPVLVPTPLGKIMRLAWPASASGFVLETTTNLAFGNWVPVPGQPLQSSNQCLMQITPGASNCSVFYRLHFTGQ